MKKITLFASVAAVVAISFSCTKEKESVISVDLKENQEEVQSPVGHEAIIGLSLGEDTKTTHSEDVVAGKTNVKTLWKAGDKILVTFTKNAVEHKEVFELSSGENTANGTFRKGDSVLEAGDSYSVTYYSSNDYDKTFSWAEQTGSVEDIPEYLTSVADATYPAAPTLQSELVHFHFNLSNAAVPSEALTLANAYFYNYNGEHAFVLDTDNNKGDIKITPATPFVYGTDGKSTNADFYVATKLAASANGDTFNVRLLNGDNYDGVQGYTLFWTSSKDYTTNKVWKKASTVENMVYNTGVLGATDNSQDWWGAVKTVSLAPDKRVNMKFINYGKGDDNWNNWHIAIDDYDPSWWLAADLAADRRIRTGNSWDPYNMVSNYDIFLTQNANPVIDWANFNANQNGARVDVTVDHSSSGYVFADVTVTSADDANVFRETYGTTASTTMNLNVTLTTVKSHYILKSIAITDIPAADKVTSVTATATAKVEGAADKIILSPYSINVTDNNAKVYKGSSHEFTVSDEIVSTTNLNTATVHFRGNNITTNCNVTKVATSVLADAGVTSLDAGNSFTAHNAINLRWTVAAGESQTIKMTVMAKDSEPAVYHCPIVEIWNTEWNTCYGDAGMHNGRWGTGLEAECMKKSTNWANDAEIITALKATPTVYVTVSNDGNGQASIRYYVEYTKDTTNYTRYNYYENIVVPKGDFKFCLASEECILNF